MSGLVQLFRWKSRSYDFRYAITVSCARQTAAVTEAALMITMETLKLI